MLIMHTHGCVSLMLLPACFTSTPQLADEPMARLCCVLQIVRNLADKDALPPMAVYQQAAVRRLQEMGVPSSAFQSSSSVSL